MLKTVVHASAAALLLLTVAVPTGAQTPPPPRQRLLINEIHNGPSAAGGPPIRYIELINLHRFTPPAPGGLFIAGGSLTILTDDGVNPVPAMGTITFAPGLSGLIPGPPPGQLAFTYFVVSSAPTGTPPQNELVVPGLFSQVGNMLQPGVTTRIILDIPQIGGQPAFRDEIIIDQGTGPIPGPATFDFNFLVAPIVPNAAGHINRALFTQSFTGYDYETVTTIESPGLKNPVQDHINGFQWDTPGSEGFPYTINAAFGALVNMVDVPVTGIRVDHHPQYGPLITDPAFDRVLVDGVVNVPNMMLQGTDGLLANAGAPAGQQFRLTVPDIPGVINPVLDGRLDINQTILTEAYATYGVSGTSAATGATPVRIERILTDTSGTDGTTSATGNVTEVQLDVIPPNTEGGDLWCEIIIYDMGGNAYKAKVRNWPPNPQNCSGGGNSPLLSLVTPGGGELDVVALCFPAGAEVFILPSLNVSTPTGTGPFFGINPDFFSLFALSAPLGAAPFHVNCTDDGLYWFKFPAGSFPTSVSFAFDAVAIEVIGVTAGSFSNSATVV